MKSPQKEPKKLNRICFLNPHGYVFYPPQLGKTDTGGQTLYEFELARALGKRNIKVDIVTRLFDDSLPEEEIFPNVKIIRIPCGKKEFISKEKLYELMPEMMENFMHYIEKSKKVYDLIHSHYWDAGYAGILLAKMLDIPHIHTPHTLGKAKKMEMALEEAPVQKLKPFYRYHVRIAIEQKIISTAKAIVVLCETSRIQILQHYMADFEKLHVIFPGVDTDIFQPKSNSHDNKFKFANNSILTMSRLVPAKGIDRVIEAISHIKNQAEFHLYIGGGSIEGQQSKEEMDTYNQLQELIARHKLKDKVTFLGRIPHTNELAACYRKADIFILGGRYEPFGLTTLETMACGTVPIVSSVAGSKEIIVDGLNGFVTNTADTKGLSEVILKILNDSKLRKKVSENAAFTIKEHYSWDKVVEKFITLYKKLL
ncbi:MAG: glycosyltransferase [bacterium]|nr:glycosyltransferase [bacterium]